MIYINKSLDPNNFMVCTLSEVATISADTRYYLVSLKSLTNNNLYYQVLPDVSVNTYRYNKLVFSGSTFSTLPLGDYNYEVYEQDNDTNLDPSGKNLLEIGLLKIVTNSDIINYITDGNGITFKIID